MAPQEFGNQVAGHISKAGKPYFLTDEDENLWKLIDEDKEGNNEEMFYMTLYGEHQQNKDLVMLKKWVPGFYGEETICYNGIKSKYLKIENLLKYFNKPCIMDVKIGKVTWSPHASNTKIVRESSKCNVQNAIGIRISGFKVYNSVTKAYTCLRRQDIGPIQPEDVSGVFARFFLLNEKPSHIHVLSTIISRLKEVLKWAELQTSAKLIATSILIIYEGMEGSFQSGITDFKYEIETNGNGIEKQRKEDGRRVEVKIIDFTHARIDPNGSDIDTNYSEGLKNLIYQFEYLYNNVIS